MYALVTYENKHICSEYLFSHLQRVPSYWETPVLDGDFNRTKNDLSKKPVIFNSTFAGTIQLWKYLLLNNVRYIQLLDSFYFSNVEYDYRRKHKDKITYNLEGEGYVFDEVNQVYYKKYLRSRKILSLKGSQSIL